MQNSHTKIIIIDDHPLIVDGLQSLLQNHQQFSICGTADTQQQALELIDKNRPDMMIVDLFLKESSGLDLIKVIHSKYPEINILVLSMFDEKMYAERVIKAGAKGYIMKQSISKELVNAIEKVKEGKIYLSPEMSEMMLNRLSKTGDIKQDIYHILSDREMEVLKFIGAGLTTKEIADNLFLGIKTVETYKTKIKEKLNLKNSNQLIKFAVEWLIQEQNSGNPLNKIEG